MITAESNDQELRQYAGALAYQAGGGTQALCLEVARLIRQVACLEEQLKDTARDAANWRAAQPRLAEIERRLAQLEAVAPHLAKVERR